MKIGEIIENLKKLDPKLGIREALEQANIPYSMVTPEESINPEIKRIFGLAGPGQPPKSPEDKRQKVATYFSQREMEEVEKARKKESPSKRTGAYIRDAAMAHVKKINEEN